MTTPRWSTASGLKTAPIMAILRLRCTTQKPSSIRSTLSLTRRMTSSETPQKKTSTSSSSKVSIIPFRCRLTATELGYTKESEFEKRLSDRKKASSSRSRSKSSARKSNQKNKVTQFFTPKKVPVIFSEDLSSWN